MYVDVAVNRPLRQTFHYHIPPELVGKLDLGHMVEVSFGTALTSGMIVGFSADTTIPKTKPIRRKLNPDPVMTPLQLDLAWWISEQTLTPIGLCVWLFLPPGITRNGQIIYRLVNEDYSPRSNVQWRIISLLKSRGEQTGNQLNYSLPKTNWRASIKNMVEKGIIEQESILRPPTIRPKTLKSAKLTVPKAVIPSLKNSLGVDSKQATVLEILRVSPEHHMAIDKLLKIADCGKGVVKSIEEKGFVELEDKTVYLVPTPSETEEIIFELRRGQVYLDALYYLADQTEQQAPIVEIMKATGIARSQMDRLFDDGLITYSEAEIYRDPLGDETRRTTLPPPLTAGQENVWEHIQRHQVQTNWQGEDSTTDTSHVFLLHGVTGSGKTEIYMRAVGEAIAQGQQAIILVPEIALTTQLSERFAARFPDQVSVIHSGLSVGERYDVWRRARDGELKIILGARSALFTPLPDIGLVVLDEEHDDSYKQSPPISAPYYHAREVAIEMMRLNQGTVIIGSATPDIVSMYRTTTGEFERLDMPDRVMAKRDQIEKQIQHLNLPDARYVPTDASEAMSAGLPPVEIIDMRQELRAGNRSVFSRLLQDHLRETLAKREQAILFLNRRGSATFVMCRNCGYIAECPNCENALTYHEYANRLMCHHCGHQDENPHACPVCESNRIRYFGSGTQQIDRMIQDTFPTARVLRWDQDAAREKGSHQRILKEFMDQRADILVGTQMIAKGLDIPLVTLVGIISADTALGLPDYRTGERTFQLLTQVAGRAGRGLRPGRVVLQTYQPEHYAILAASEHDYYQFYDQEIEYRKTNYYPPYVQLARILFREKSYDLAKHEADKVAALLHQHAKDHGFTATEIIGPAPCYFMRRDNIFRWQILIKSRDMVRFLSKVELPSNAILDIQPTNLL